MSVRKTPLIRYVLPLCAAFTLAVAYAHATARAENWPGWRGPRGDGTSYERNVPTRWSESDNVAWKAEVPGTGHASPIVWQDRIFVASCREEAQERILLC